MRAPVAHADAEYIRSDIAERQIAELRALADGYGKLDAAFALAERRAEAVLQLAEERLVRRVVRPRERGDGVRRRAREVARRGGWARRHVIDVADIRALQPRLVDRLRPWAGIARGAQAMAVAPELGLLPREVRRALKTIPDR